MSNSVCRLAWECVGGTTTTFVINNGHYNNYHCYFALAVYLYVTFNTPFNALVYSLDFYRTVRLFYSVTLSSFTTFFSFLSMKTCVLFIVTCVCLLVCNAYSMLQSSIYCIEHSVNAFGWRICILRRERETVSMDLQLTYSS